VRKQKLYILLMLAMSLSLSSPLGCRKIAEMTPEAVIVKAYAATKEVKSFHFSISVTIMGWNEGKASMEGGFLSPDRILMIIEQDGQREEVRHIGNKVYERDSETGEWRTQEGPLALAALSTMQRFAESAQPKDIAERLKGLEAIERLPDEVIDGINCVHYRGRSDPLKAAKERLANESDPRTKEALEQAMQTQAQMEMTLVTELWIGKGDYLLRQQRVTQSMKVPPEEVDKHGTPAPEGTIWTVTMVMKFSDFNQPVEIEAPF